MEARRLPDRDDQFDLSARTADLLRRPDRRRLVILIVAIVIVGGAIIFWIQNHERVRIAYLSVTVTAPLWLAVTAYLLAGILIGVLLTLYYQRRLS